MAQLLYRLGFGAAKRAWLVVLAWVMVLGLSVGLMVAGGAKLSDNISISGLASQKVIDQLKTSFASASGGSAQIVFHKKDGAAFNAAERAAISNELTKVAGFAGVSKAINPFTTQAQLEKQRADVASGLQIIADATMTIADNQGKLDTGATKLNQAEANLKAQSAKLEAGIAKAKAAGAPASMLAPLLAGRAQIAAGFKQIATQRAALVAGQAKLDKARATVATNAKKLDYAQRILKTTANFGTVAKDGKTALATIQFVQPINLVSKKLFTRITTQVSALGLATVQVEYSKEFANDLSSLLGAGEIIGLLIAAIVLFLMLGSFVAAGLPVLSAILGVGISATATMALAAVFEMNSTTPMLGVMLGLAVGIDYSLFILNRHIRQLRAGVELRESIGLATGTSGNAVVFAGLTVVIALAALNLTGIGFLGLMGTMGAVGIVLAVLVAITFTPAVLGLVGMRVLPRKARRLLAEGPIEKTPTLETAAIDRPQPGKKKLIWAAKYPWLAVFASILVLGLVAIPAASMRLGLPDGSSEASDSTQYKAYKLTTDAFGAGSNGGIITVATIPQALDATGKLKLQADIATKLFALNDVSAVLPGGVSSDGKTYVFQVIPKTGPASVATEKLVYDVRALSGSFKTEFNSTLGVTGLTATNIDVSKKLADALPLYLGTVLLLSMLLLLLVFRSILVPILASAGFLLTVFAAFGSITAVFQLGWAGALFGVHDPGPILSFLPTIIIGILFGLAMDYQLFLTSGIREAFVHGKSPKESINYGIRLSRSVVVAAAIIMISVFGGFAFSHMAMIRPMGFGLATGVLFDAFLVRLVLVPAVLSLLGKSAWWMPKWLDRLLPDVDVEGAKLEREHLH
jgi:RND superfamily putative drug exporter